MIKCKNNVFSCKGSQPEIEAELVVIIRATREIFAEKHGEEKAKKMIHECICLSFLSEEELDAEFKKALAEVLFGEN